MAAFFLLWESTPLFYILLEVINSAFELVHCFSTIASKTITCNSGRIVMRAVFGSVRSALNIFSAYRVIPAIPIQVRVARSGVDWVALQPAGGAGVIRAGAHMVQPYLRDPLIPIRPVPSKRLARGITRIERAPVSYSRTTSSSSKPCIPACHHCSITSSRTTRGACSSFTTRNTFKSPIFGASRIS
ncbi:MAG: hypothetical protein KatS3mg021_0624 [Fimbriimonadales bacterium]|nr:MAG: hypothetical protein KatS3mg021_0624 [Fimbriimonadales bacterium]